MIKSVEELKALILWAKEQKLKRLKVGDIEVEVSDISILESVQVEKLVSPPTGSMPQQATQTENEEDDELLYYSSGG